MTLRLGSLFSGYGGLDSAVAAFFRAELSWYSEIEPAACRVMDAHHPGVANLGDVTEISWDEVPPVDVLTGGYPCQPFSTAGRRKGAEDERHLWPYVRDAVGVLRPRYVVLENVRGHLTLGLDAVLADLAGLGMSAEWGVVRASDAGAPHRRERIFIVAERVPDPDGSGGEARVDAGHDGQRVRVESMGPAEPPPYPEGERRGEGPGPAAAPAGLVRAETGDGGRPSPADADGFAREQRHDAGEVARGGEGDEPRSDVDARAGGPARLRQGDPDEDAGRWGKFAAAVDRWERVTGRRAPDATVPGIDGRGRLSPQFVEWMMGLPGGWVTGRGLSASQELKLLGNGVVPQQAFLALHLLRVE